MGVGSHLKALLISMGAYIISFSISSPPTIDPMPGDPISLIGWVFGVIAKLFGYAAAAMSWSIMPSPLNWILTVFFGGLFIYGITGVILDFIKSIKIPFAG